MNERVGTCLEDQHQLYSTYSACLYSCCSVRLPSRRKETEETACRVFCCVLRDQIFDLPLYLFQLTDVEALGVPPNVYEYLDSVVELK
jgi:hypothetical protein